MYSILVKKVLLSKVVYIDQKEILSTVNNNLETTVFHASCIKSTYIILIGFQNYYIMRIQYKDLETGE